MQTVLTWKHSQYRFRHFESLHLQPVKISTAVGAKQQGRTWQTIRINYVDCIEHDHVRARHGIRSEYTITRKDKQWLVAIESTHGRCD